MRNKQYTVKRDNIYVGRVISTSNLYELGDNKIEPGGYRDLRTMIFVKDPYGFASDLLYNSPNYPIFSMTNNEKVLCHHNRLNELAIDNQFYIYNICNLSELLKYFGYDEELTYDDIKEIRKKFFDGNFAKDNCELFGWHETMAEDLTFYDGDRKVTDPKIIAKRQRQYRADQKLGHRSFTSNGNAKLNREYFDKIDDLYGNNSLIDIINGWGLKINEFKPSKMEGRIKRLHK